MSRWDHWGWYKVEPKRPPPAHGIKVGKIGSTWWGQRWVEALERMSFEYSNRLARGRTYARAGRTHDLVVKPGRVTAKVTGSRPRPYEVTMQLTTLSGSAWKKAIQAMASRAQFAAELLAGQMPKEIDKAFRGGGASLFPTKETDLVTECSCPDWANPCKHVAATHYVLGEAFDRDPFLLFELRGRTKNQVLDALRTARAGKPTPKGKGGGGGSVGIGAGERAGAEITGVAFGKITPAAYDAPREALPALHLTFDEPVAHGAVLRQLGAPAAWHGDWSPADLLAPLVRAAAERARRIALAEPEADAPDEASERSVSPRGAMRPRAGASLKKALVRPARKANTGGAARRGR